MFTLTEKDSAKIRYGISLNFFLNYERKTNESIKNRSTSNLQNKLLNLTGAKAPENSKKNLLNSATILKSDNNNVKK